MSKHDHDCDCDSCRLYLYRCETALKVICTWAKCDADSDQSREAAMLEIRRKCQEVLGLKEETE